MSIEVKVWNEIDFPYRAELRRAIDSISSAQDFFLLDRIVEPLPELRKTGALDFHQVNRRKRTKFGDTPAVVATHHPLKDGWIAYPFRDFYIFSTGRNQVRPQLPPPSTLFAYFIAGILGSFECRLTSAQTDTRTHMGPPTGCIGDYCDTDEDLYESMKGAHICDRCKDIYRKYKISNEGLAAVSSILKVVQEETILHDRSIPYDVFISYKSEDYELIKPLIERFRKERFKVWFDDSTLLPGKKVDQSLKNGASAALNFVVALSQRSIESHWCQLELAAALSASESSNGSPQILPVVISEANLEIPTALQNYKRAYLYGVSATRDLNLLCSAIRAERDTHREQNNSIRPRSLGGDA